MEKKSIKKKQTKNLRTKTEKIPFSSSDWVSQLMKKKTARIKSLEIPWLYLN